MSYYMGDYYPRGDPGIRSFFGKVLKIAGPLVPVVGPQLGRIGELIGGGARVAPAAVSTAGAIAEKAGAAIVKHPGRAVLTAAGIAGAMGAAGERMMGPSAPLMAHGHCIRISPKGRHIKINCVTGKAIRRMNPFNPRAARRSARRLHSLTRHFRRYIGFVSARKPKGRPYVKRGRKK